jgi:ribonuclease PH
VIQADGGTRTAAITGGFVALHQCLSWMEKRQLISTRRVVKDHVAAVSCGIFQGVAVTDLDYPEDSNAETDANFVITGSGGLVEVQGTAEGAPFSEAQFLELMAMARNATQALVDKQREAIAAF